MRLGLGLAAVTAAGAAGMISVDHVRGQLAALEACEATG